MIQHWVAISVGFCDTLSDQVLEELYFSGYSDEISDIMLGKFCESIIKHWKSCIYLGI